MRGTQFFLLRDPTFDSAGPNSKYDTKQSMIPAEHQFNTKIRFGPTMGFEFGPTMWPSGIGSHIGASIGLSHFRVELITTHEKSRQQMSHITCNRCCPAQQSTMSFKLQARNLARQSEMHKPKLKSKTFLMSETSDLQLQPMLLTEKHLCIIPSTSQHPMLAHPKGDCNDEDIILVLLRILVERDYDRWVNKEQRHECSVRGTRACKEAIY